MEQKVNFRTFPMVYHTKGFDIVWSCFDQFGNQVVVLICQCEGTARVPTCAVTNEVIFNDFPNPGVQVPTSAMDPRTTLIFSLLSQNDVVSIKASI